MKSISIIARQMVIDHLKKMNLSPNTVPITKELLCHARLSSGCYEIFRKEEVSKKKKEEDSLQLDILDKEIKDLKSKIL